MSCLSTLQDHFADEFLYPIGYNIPLQLTRCPNPCNIDVDSHGFSYRNIDLDKETVKEHDIYCETKPINLNFWKNW